MQVEPNEYNKEIHDRFKALTVKQPWANFITLGIKKIEVRSRPTKYRGDVVICSSKNPVYDGMVSGAALSIVEIVDCRKISDMLPEDWVLTCLPEEDRDKYLDHYGWIVRNPRRVIEIPVSGYLGIWNLVLGKDELIEYPVHLQDVEGKYNQPVKERKKDVRDRNIVMALVVLVAVLMVVITKMCEQ